MATVKGQITQDDQTAFWSCDGHASVRLFGNAKAHLKDKKLPALVHGFMQGLGKHDATARQRLVDRYYDLWLDAWSHGFDGSLSREEFAQYLSVPSVSYPDGQYLTCFSISYDPGTLFGDHGLYVVVSPDGTIVDDGMM